MNSAECQAQDEEDGKKAKGKCQYVPGQPKASTHQGEGAASEIGRRAAADAGNFVADQLKWEMIGGDQATTMFDAIPGGSGESDAADAGDA